MLTKDNNLRVMRLFFESPEKKFHIREIARLTGLSAAGVIKILARLKDEELIDLQKEKMVSNAFAKRGEKFILMKRCFNIISLYESGFIDFLRDEYEEPECIALFGSYSRGDDTSESDIDIAIITGKEKNLNLKPFEKQLKRPVSIYEIDIKECEKEFLNNLANGAVLYGHLRLIS